MAGNLFQISGLGSGVDSASILDALRQYKLRPALLEQKKQDTYAARQRVWQDINSRLLSVKNAADPLTKASVFSGMKATVGDATVASASASETAATGTYSLGVTQLAQARKVVSSAFSDPAAARGLSGDFTVNGKTVRVTADDSLNSLAAKINALGAGASAAVIQVSAGNYQMTIGGTATGLRDSLSLAPVGASSSLTTLGLISSGTDTRYKTTGPAGTTAHSLGFSSKTDKLGVALGLASEITSGSFTVNGAAVSYDTSQDTLSTLATKINDLGVAGLSAAVVADTDNSAKYRLQVTTTTGEPLFVDGADGLLGMIGITQVQTDAAKVVASAMDAEFTLDGLSLKRPTNTVSDALTGVTLNLVKAGTTTFTVSRDTQGAAEIVKSFVFSYNDAMEKIEAQSKFAGVGTRTPPLFGDFTLQQIQQQLIDSVTGSMEGQPAGFSTLLDIGITQNGNGTLKVDDAALTAALNKDSNSVSKLFNLVGSTTNSSVTFAAASSETKTSTGSGYEVHVTAAAEKALVRGGAIPLLPSDETLTFSGGLFSTATTVAIAGNTSLVNVIKAINDSAAGEKIEAFDDGGVLGIRSKAYGSSQSFSVVSDNATGSSGIGTTALNDTGVDIAGYFVAEGNTETATGTGQTLTGNQTNAATKGLVVTATATGPGMYGYAKVQRGAAATAQQLIAQLTDFTSGTVKLEQDTLQQRIDDSRETVTRMTERVDAYIARMQAQFTRMESQVSLFKAQSNQLSSQLSALTQNNK